MRIPNTRLEKFDAEASPEQHWQDFITMQQVRHTEENPDDPIPPVDVLRRQMEAQGTAERFDIEAWLLYQEGIQDALASAITYCLTPKSEDYESKREIGFVNMYVRQPYRRQGIGTFLLKHLATELKKTNRTIMECGTELESGNRFLEQMGAMVTLKMQGNRLPLSEVDWAMVERWATEGQARNPETTLHEIVGLPSDDILPNFAELLEHIFAQMPKEDASGFPENITPESVRDRQQQMEKTGRITLVAVTQEADGTLSAMTDIIYQPDEPHLIDQGLTGVHLDARGRGLGKWLKAAMLLKIREQYPDAKFVETYNANVNAAMLEINEKLGFTQHNQNVDYKLIIEDVLAQ